MKSYRFNFLQEFENIECEWPLFYIFMIMDGVFKGLPQQVEEYRSLLANVICKDLNGGEYYLVEIQSYRYLKRL